MSKPTDQLTQILSNSPFAEPNHAIRGEALEFILDFVSRFHIQEHVALFPFWKIINDVNATLMGANNLMRPNPI